MQKSPKVIGRPPLYLFIIFDCLRLPWAGLLPSKAIEGYRRLQGYIGGNVIAFGDPGMPKTPTIGNRLFGLPMPSITIPDRWTGSPKMKELFTGDLR
jgi:hypothetical protein